MRAQVRVSGLRELQREVRKAKGSEGRKALTRANRKAANIVRDDARTVTVPRKSGRLAGSIRATAGAAKAAVMAGSARVPYAGVINYGWPAGSMRQALSTSSSAYWRRVASKVSGIKGREFLNRAVARKLPEVRETYIEELERVLRSISTN